MIRAILPTATGLLFIATSSPAWADHPVVGGGVSHGSPIVTIAADTLPQGVLAGGIQDELRLVDEHDREVATGEVGELIVRTGAPWTLNAGYYRNPEATAEAWRNGWFHTGDAMTMDADGNFYFVDRMKDCIRRRGENISSFELEAFALGYPGVAEAAAVGIAMAEGEEEVKIFIVNKVDADIDLDAMGAWLAEQMPKFMLPRYLEIIPEFPKTPATGRVRKSELRANAAGQNQWDRLARGRN